MNTHVLHLINTPGIGNGFNQRTVDMIRQAQRDGELSGEVKFTVKLRPQSEPVLDKVKFAAGEFKKYKQALSGSGLKVGLVAQFILHGDRGITVCDSAKFPRCVNVHGKATPRICPLGRNILQYAFDAFRILAEAGPDMIDMDEDIRLSRRSECFCDLHLARFRRESGRSLSRGELSEILKKTDSASLKTGELWYRILLDSQVEFARMVRKGIDSVNPSLPCYNKIIAGEIDFGIPVSLALAGNMPPVVRVNNGLYMVHNAEWLPGRMYQTALQIHFLRKAGVQRILSESDACREHRFCTSAKIFHAQITGSIIEGVDDVEMRDMDPPDWRTPFRESLIRNSPFYRELAKLVRGCRWLGPSVPLPSKPVSCWNPLGVNPMNDFFWFGHFCGRLGFPVRTGQESDTLLLEGGQPDAYSDAEIRSFLGKTLFLTGEAAERLSRRGFGKYLGAEIRNENIRVDGEELADQVEWNGAAAGISLSVINSNLELKTLIPLPETKILSWFFNVPWTHSSARKRRSPAMTLYRNELGGNVVILAPSRIRDGFQLYDWVNPQRKEQFAALFRFLRGDNAGLYVKGDYACFVRHGVLSGSGKELLCVVNLCHDTMPAIELGNAGMIQRLEQLMPDASRKKLSFTRLPDGSVRIAVKPELLEPVIMLITRNR